ncbi:hypothetical protein M9Y10_023299 [Tritrichomonas musculus]|uniref:Mediator of RNA polymerase II transcription subunit 21 n=1 Tax=Tritrichomonas musculus TaxID=1915356 RepID=A0ABR2KUP5_9EUKA
MTTTSIPDHVGMLQEAFADLLNTMFTTISNIQRDAASSNSGNDPNQIKFDQLPQLADQIVKKTKNIDNIIDQANDETCIGKDIQEIKDTLSQKAESYENDVKDLDESCAEAEKWLGRIRQMLDVIAANTPWMQRFEPNSHP